MKIVKTQDAVGMVLCHDITKIVKDEFKGAYFKKGHIIKEEDIEELLKIGKDHIYVWEDMEGMLHENEGAKRLSDKLYNDGMTMTDVSEGKIELKSNIEGVFFIDEEQLFKVNMIDEIIVATIRNSTLVKPGDKLMGTRVIPLVIDENKVKKAEEILSEKKVAQVLPYKVKKAALITTGNEVFYGRIKDAFGPVVEEKLKKFNIEIVWRTLSDDNKDNIIGKIEEAKKQDVDMILVTGGMSVDPDDRTPGAIKNCVDNVVTYGSPVLPGAMIMFGYYENDKIIVGLPGCVMYAKATVFDKLLPKFVCKVKVNREDIARLGVGGLCLGCKECHFPNCSFGN